MKIPLGDFGYRPGELAPTPSVGAGSFVQPGLDEAGKGVAAVGEAASAIGAAQAQAEHAAAQKAADEAKAEAKALATEAKRAEAMTIHAKAQNDLADAQDQLKNKVLDGSLPVDQAGELWKKTSQEIVDAHLLNVDKVNTPLVQAGLLGIQGSLTRNLNDAVVARNKQTIGASLNDYEEQMGRLFLKDPATARTQMATVFDAQGPLAGLNPEQIQKRKQAFIETGTFNAANQYLTQNMNNGKALNDFMKTLPTLNDLDPAKKNILESKGLTMIGRLEAKAARAEASRLATVGAMVSSVDSMIMKGYEPSAQQMTELQRASRGTPYAANVDNQIVLNKQTAAFRAAPPIAKERFIAELEGEVRKSPTPEAIQTVERMKAIYKAQTEEVKADPVSYVTKNNLADIQPLDMTKPNTIAAQIAARIPVLRGMKDQYRAPMKPVTEQEAQLLADNFKGLQPPQKAEMLRSLTAGIGDGEAVKELAGQIAPKDKGLSTAMLLASRDLQTTKGRTVAELYLKGQDALKNKTAKMDEHAESGTRAELVKALDGVYVTPEGRDAAVDASLHVYAGMKAEGQDDLTRATRLATGGVMSYNSGKIAKPYGWTDSRFTDAVSKISVDDLKAAGGLTLPKDWTATGPKAAPGMVQPGNIDLTKRPSVKNADGSISTVRSMGVNIDGKEVLIPTVVDGKVVSDEAAIANYKKTGQHLGIFNSPKASDTYAQALHDQQERMYAGGFRVGNVTMTAEQLREALPAAQLQTVDDGVYAIRSDAGYVRRPDGRPLTINLMAIGAPPVKAKK